MLTGVEHWYLALVGFPEVLPLIKRILWRRSGLLVRIYRVHNANGQSGTTSEQLLRTNLKVDAEGMRWQSLYGIRSIDIAFSQVLPVFPDPRHNCDACTTVASYDER
jgi:hypothetical protein